MKYTHNKSAGNGFRAWVKRLLGTGVNQHAGQYAEDFQDIRAKLQDIEDKIDIIARQVGRWAMKSPTE